MKVMNQSVMCERCVSQSVNQSVSQSGRQSTIIKITRTQLLTKFGIVQIQLLTKFGIDDKRTEEKERKKMSIGVMDMVTGSIPTVGAFFRSPLTDTKYCFSAQETDSRVLDTRGDPNTLSDPNTLGDPNILGDPNTVVNQ
ncbi:hypothetical protein DPMN_032878 [Dreissena polymorpha]|uniref:Uncharacterized protein n=1 Tax=Dreissena polymorpha TaxID=45954 RepID=A0A9D4M3U7_DREPO|nr:hypothetical protein DPMN_032878 [Dreissena polymorpha]